MVPKRKHVFVGIIFIVVLFLVTAHFVLLKPTKVDCPVIENLINGKPFHMDIEIPMINLKIKRIDDQNLIKDTCELLERINIRPQSIDNNTFKPTYGNQYFITVYAVDESERFTIQIMDSEHVILNAKVFRITNDADLPQINALLKQYGYLSVLD